MPSVYRAMQLQELTILSTKNFYPLFTKANYKLFAGKKKHPN